MWPPRKRIRLKFLINRAEKDPITLGSWVLIGNNGWTRAIGEVGFSPITKHIYMKHIHLRT